MAKITTLESIRSRIFDFSEICAVCHLAILERYFLVLEHRSYHPHCLRCALCHCGLSYEPTCYVKDGLVLCRRDYTAKFRKACTKCRLRLENDDVVMRAREAVFHVHCFSCVVCDTPLNAGDIFTMTERGEIFCQRSLSSGWGIGTYFPPPPPRQKDRSKRMRTSFKHHQLRTMKQYFNLNHNPDAKDLKQLAQKTGLTKRVLQVIQLSHQLMDITYVTTLLPRFGMYWPRWKP
ncbi:unnamed protein product [Haemonchus placei]|uniref:LIM zinc-binding domain-containing protein n=1 Tax=Haemonchus placei TaxID=6290 RepID=A0A3P8B4M1_HAEPC|nr:unnamed protein product [Haemonchus placei]